MALGRTFNTDAQGTNFTFVAKALGCDFEDADTELQCMRNVPMTRIENFVGQYQDNSTLLDTKQPAIAFTRRGESRFPVSWLDSGPLWFGGSIAACTLFEEARPEANVTCSSSSP